MVHLYGRFPRKTSNSKPVVNTISQLKSLQKDVSARDCLPMTNKHVDASNSMAQFDESDWVTVKSDID